MSFAKEVKKELQSLKHLQCCNRAELSAMLHINGSIEKNTNGISIVFSTTNNSVVRRFLFLYKQLYNYDFSLIQKQVHQFKSKEQFIVKLNESVDVLMNDLSLINKDAIFFRDIDSILIENTCCKKAYIRGAFLASGSINSPDTSAYHLEIQSYSKEHAESLKQLMDAFHLNAKVSKNKRGFITYVKEAERIADFLKVIGASNQLFVFEDSRINILYIEKFADKKITKSMGEAIYLRKKYPEASLSELSRFSEEDFENPISKSALNHRFRAIKDLANKIKIFEGHKHD